VACERRSTRCQISLNSIREVEDIPRQAIRGRCAGPGLLCAGEER
jgi:hypothetical protein